MKKYGFLFGAGAEIAYNMPSGGKFALDIFRRDNKKAKNDFKQMRERVDSTTSYANKWLPKLYMVKSITTFGKTIFQNIIINTLEHRRKQIIDKINKFDTIAEAIIEEEDSEFSNIDVSFRAVIERDVGNILYNQKLKYNDAFSDGNLLFESKYFSALLATYIKINDRQNKLRLKKYLLSIVQIHLGALCEESMLNINDNIFVNQEDEIDFLDDFGNILQLNYSSSGVMGLEVLFDGFVEQGTTDLDKIVKFTYTIAENIYSSVLDYKNLIDSNWMYLYNPSSDWAKFCKISIFLLSVNEYISELGEDANKENENGYYNWLKKALDDNKISISAVATTNYNSLIKDILNLDVTYLNGSVNEWYDPYLNKIGTKEELDNEEHHIIVPLIFMLIVLI